MAPLLGFEVRLSRDENFLDRTELRIGGEVSACGQPVSGRHIDVDQHAIKPDSVSFENCGQPIVRHRHRVSPGFQFDSDQFGELDIIVDDKKLKLVHDSIGNLDLKRQAEVEASRSHRLPCTELSSFDRVFFRLVGQLFSNDGFQV